LLRDTERRKIFDTKPKPNTYGAFLEKKHILFSKRFEQRELFGEEQIPYIHDEPREEFDWKVFNENMRELYLEKWARMKWKKHSPSRAFTSLTSNQ